MKIAGHFVGTGRCLVIAEAGLNHNGDLAQALALVQAAKAAGADVVKFQKRDPDISTPAAMRDTIRETPWGAMTYLDYRHRLEFGRAQYDAIDAACRRLELPWTASVWDVPSVAFLDAYDVPALKIPSPRLTDDALLHAAIATGRPIIASTGMSTVEEIDHAFGQLEGPEGYGWNRLVFLHCRSIYPAPPNTLNLRAMATLATRYGVPVGYSDHNTGLWMALAAVALGAAVIERHFTLDRALWGSDQAWSTEPRGLEQLVRQIRRVESALGDGSLGPHPDEAIARARLRGDGS